MITRKAAVGFILLAVIVFAVSSYDTANPIKIPEKQAVVEQQTIHSDTTNSWQKSEYHPPLVDFGKMTPYIVTGTMELFALVCYLFLKKVEPRINSWAEETRNRIKQERKSPE